MNKPELSPELCRARQQRLLEMIEPLGADFAVLTCKEVVQWLTGVRLGPLLPVAAAIDGAGRVTLTVPKRKTEMSPSIDELVEYDATWGSTMRDDRREACSAALLSSIASPKSRVACEFSSLDQHLAGGLNCELADIDPILFLLRRHKDPDELAMIAWANEANRAMYEHARRIVEPGLNELELYNELQAVAVRQVGEALTYFGQDFQCGSRGGPPRDREAQAGELHILDLGVGYRGYFCDNARTIAVGGAPTDDQQRAWSALAKVFPLVETTVQPGVSCRGLFEQVQEMLDEFLPWAFNHHLGHGFGLSPHEGPHLNPNWDDHFEPGDCFTVEPGLYHEDLRFGIRLEQNYLVTDTGVELLTDWPLEL